MLDVILPTIENAIVAMKNGIMTDEINAVIKVVNVAISGLKNAEEFTPPNSVVNVSITGNTLSIRIFILEIVSLVSEITPPTSVITMTITAL